jgi:hypothetical protein
MVRGILDERAADADRPAAADLKQPSKRELREQLAEAVRNTAAIPVKGKRK